MNKCFRLLTGLLIAPLLSGCSIQESNPAETGGAAPLETRRPGGLRLLLNSDGGDAALMAFEPPITPRQLCRAVNEIEGTQVDVFIQCIQWSDEQMLYPTQVTEVYAKPISEDHKRDFEKYPGIRRWARNVDAMLEAGEDPLEIWSRRSREAGMQFWPSLRMNDIHKDWSERWPSFRSQWERANPQVRLGSAVPDRYLHHSNRSPQPSHGYSWAMDYALEEVRDRKLAIIEEVCTNYDVDGFEMDFLSHPYYFKKGEAVRGMPLMNDRAGQVDACRAGRRRHLPLLPRAGDDPVVDDEHRPLDRRRAVAHDESGTFVDDSRAGERRLRRRCPARRGQTENAERGRRAGTHRESWLEHATCLTPPVARTRGTGGDCRTDPGEPCRRPRRRPAATARRR